MINRSDLVEELQQKLPYSKKELALFIDVFLDQIADHLHKREQVNLPTLGKFFLRHTPPRTARNPMTAQPIQIPGKLKLVFRASKSIKDKINQP